jgi:hypothetical protein
MGHSWSYSLCDRHSMCLLQLCVTPNILDKLPNLGTEVYWQMACFLWLRVFVDTSHRHTSHNFPESTELTSNQSETPYTYYSFQLNIIPYIQLHIYEFVYYFSNIRIRIQIYQLSHELWQIQLAHFLFSIICDDFVVPFLFFVKKLFHVTLISNPKNWGEFSDKTF